MIVPKTEDRVDPAANTDDAPCRKRRRLRRAGVKTMVVRSDWPAGAAEDPAPAAAHNRLRLGNHGGRRGAPSQPAVEPAAAEAVMKPAR